MSRLVGMAIGVFLITMASFSYAPLFDEDLVYFWTAAIATILAGVAGVATVIYEKRTDNEMLRRVIAMEDSLRNFHGELVRASTINELIVAKDVASRVDKIEVIVSDLDWGELQGRISRIEAIMEDTEDDKEVEEVKDQDDTQNIAETTS